MQLAAHCKPTSYARVDSQCSNYSQRVFAYILGLLQEAQLGGRACIPAAGRLDLRGTHSAVGSRDWADDAGQWPVAAWLIIFCDQDEVSRPQWSRISQPSLTDRQGRQILAAPSPPDMVHEPLRVPPAPPAGSPSSKIPGGRLGEAWPSRKWFGVRAS